MRSYDVDMQLSAFAAAADRANRPTSLLAFPLLLAVIATVVLLWSFSQFSAARAIAGAEAENQVRIDSLVSAIEAESQAALDFEKLYPPNPYVSSEINASWRESGVNFSTPPIVSDPVRSVALAGPAGTIHRLVVSCSVTSEPLEEILQWIDNVLRNPTLQGHVWVSHLQLSPSGNGWRANIRFALYQFRK